MAFFTQHDLSEFSSAWDDRKEALKKQRLDACGNVLFNLLKSKFESRDYFIRDKMFKAIKSATTTRWVEVSIWSYNDVGPINFGGKVSPTEMEDARSGGHCWMVSTDSGYEAPVNEVIRKTNVLSRLAHLFGAEHFRVYAVRSRSNYHPDYTVIEYELRLRYYPDKAPASFHVGPAVTGDPDADGRILKGTPSVYVYEGDNALQQAARDTLAGLMCECMVCDQCTEL